MIKQKLTKNFGLKVMAFVFSLFLWLIVVNVDDPVTQQTFSNIPVSLENQDIITQQGNVYQVLDGQNVTAVISARRSVLQDIESDDIIATADVKEMDTDTGLIPVEISVANLTAGRDYQTAASVPNNLRIQVEKSGKKVLPLTASTSDVSTRDGYIIGNTTVSPERVTITGAESQIEVIDRAVAYVEASGLSKDTDLTAELRLLDKNGNILDQNQLTNNLGEDGITVHLEILGSKSVPLNFGVSGTPADGYQYVGVSSEPESVVIYGTQDVLNEIDSIDIPDSEINIDGATENVETSIDITPYLPEETRLVDENGNNILVTARVAKEGTKSFDIPVGSITVNNLDDDLTISGYGSGDDLEVHIGGPQAQLDSLELGDLSVSIDLKSCTKAGEYEVPVTITLPSDASDCSVETSVTVKVTLEQRTTAADNNSNSAEEDTDNESSGG